LTASAAWLTGDPNARLAASMLIAPFVVDLAWKLARRPRLWVSVAPRRTRAGLPFVERVRVGTLAPDRTVLGLELVENRTRTRAGGARLEALPAGTSADFELTARAPRRGIQTERVFDAATAHPFGMLRWSTRVVCASRMVVEPARTRLSTRVLDSLDRSAREPQAIGAAPAPEYFALREYHSGEDARLVHAGRSASLGFLVARELRGARTPDCALVVDLRQQPGRSSPFGDRRAERRLSLAASLCDELLARDLRPACIVVGADTERLDVEQPAQLTRFLDLLAGADLLPFRPLPDDFLEMLPSDGACYWVAVGGVAPPRTLARRVEPVLADDPEDIAC
jgi:uncharacterized protein (DUF58 family)